MSTSSVTFEECSTRLNWKKTSEQNLNAYRSAVIGSEILNRLGTSVLNKDDIESADTVCEVLLEKSKEHLPISEFKPFLKPYWNTNLSDLRKIMLHHRNNCFRAGRR